MPAALPARTPFTVSSMKAVRAGLARIPLAVESFDFVVRAERASAPAVAAFLETLGSPAFAKELAARVPGLAQLATRVLELPVTIGKTTSVNGLKSTLDQPEFATPIGLVKFGSFKFRKRDARPSLVQNLKNVFSRVLPR